MKEDAHKLELRSKAKEGETEEEEQIKKIIDLKGKRKQLICRVTALLMLLVLTCLSSPLSSLSLSSLLLHSLSLSIVGNVFVVLVLVFVAAHLGSLTKT